MTLVLTTATNPGTAQWTNASLLGGAKFAKFLFVSAPDVIPAAVVGGAAFTNKLTIPAGTIAQNDLMSLAFTVQVAYNLTEDPAPANYTVGVRINGVVGTVGAGTVNVGQSYPINFGISGGTLGGVPVGGATGTIALLGLLQDNAYFSSASAIVTPVDLTGPVDIEVWFDWAVGSNLSAYAQLGFIQTTLVAQAP